MSFLCYTGCVNMRRIVMASLGKFIDNAGSFVKRKTRTAFGLLAIGAVGFSGFSCSTKGDPGPAKGVDEYKIEHDTVGINIRMGTASTNYLMPLGIVQPDRSIIRGFNVIAKGDDDSYLATGSSSVDMTKFSMVIDTSNITYASTSVENALNGFRLAPKNPDLAVVKYYPADPKGELKDIVETFEITKPDGGKIRTTKHNHVREASLLVPANGVPLLGDAFTKKTFEAFIRTSAANTIPFSQKNVMDLAKGSKTTLYSLKK